MAVHWDARLSEAIMRRADYRPAQQTAKTTVKPAETINSELDE
jgi:hypothetical protein